MEAERAAVATAVRAVGAQPNLFEEFGGMDSDAEAAYLSQVRCSDIYVGILGPKYGRPLPSRFSATHEEFREAEKSGLRICTWAAADANREGPQQSFLDELRVFYVASTYTSPDDLGEQVSRRLRRIAAEELSPWCKLGRSVFRATEITEDGSAITARAEIRDASVAAEVQRLRPSQFSGGSRTTFTWSAGCAPVEVRRVETRSRASRIRDVNLECSVLDAFEERHHGLADIGTDGRGPDDLTELGLRVVLFGEPNPLGVLSSLAEVTDPFAQLRPHDVPEDSLRPIARLLISEVLMPPGRAERLTGFRLGLPRQGKRRLQLSWMPRRRYVNVEPAERSIEGVVEL